MDDTTRVDALHDRIETALGDGLDEQWDDVLDQWTGAAPSERAAVRADVSERRDRMRRALLAMEAGEGLERGLAAQYLEVRSHWTVLTLQIQHQDAPGEDRDEALLYRATCMSLIVQRLEPLLNRVHLNTLTSLLAEPMEMDSRSGGEE